MATTTPNPLILFTITIGFLAISATARPCKTIFFITTTTDSIQNPNEVSAGSNGPYLTFFFTEAREFQHPRSSSLRLTHRPIFLDHSRFDSDFLQKPSYSAVKTSIRDRTMDIMSIVGALLFGVGCGALTAATMYLVWSLFSPRRFELEAEDSDEEFEEEEYASDPKKLGYLEIPATTPAALSSPAPPPADAKDVGAGAGAGAA